jgi:phosphate uptake regulator
MIKEIIAVFKSDNLLDRAFNRSFEMLDLTNKMFLEAKDVLRNTDSNKLDIDINDQDLKVNKFQREVRKDVFNHLTLAGTETLSSDLVLINIVIDLERIGDMTKNMVEIAKIHPERLTSKVFDEKIEKIESSVTENFSKTIKAFKESDEVLGREIMDEYKWVSKLCDEILMSLMKDEDPGLKAPSAVAIALYIRQLKRVNAHLINVASSLVNPFHRIGFKAKKKKN